MIKRLLAWLFAKLFAKLIDEIAVEIYGAEDRILARMKYQEDEIWPLMFEKLEKYLSARIVDGLAEQSFRVISGRPNTRATTPLDEQEVPHVD